jgi:carbon-monoxide dehydrogenase medium subunit
VATPITAGDTLKPGPFDYHCPDTAGEAVRLLAELGDEAKVLAGGQSLIPMLALRLTAFEHLVDVSRVAELQGIERRNGSLWVGAGTTESAVEHSPEVASAAPLLTAVSPYIGHFQIRNRGTLGGSIAHADPAGEYPAVALALDATMEVLSPAGSRTIAASEFFEGLWTTTMEPHELLVGVSFPVWSGRCGFATEQFARRHGDFAIAGAVVAVELDGDDVSRCAIGLFGLGATPERAAAAEAQAVGQRALEVEGREVGRLAMEPLASVPTDSHGSADYRKRVGAAMVARAWDRAITEARSA